MGCHTENGGGVRGYLRDQGTVVAVVVGMEEEGDVVGDGDDGDSFGIVSEQVTYSGLLLRGHISARSLAMCKNSAWNLK